MIELVRSYSRIPCPSQDSHKSCHNIRVQLHHRYTSVFSCSAWEAVQQFHRLARNTRTHIAQRKGRSRPHVHVHVRTCASSWASDDVSIGGKPGNVLGAAHALEQNRQQCPFVGFCACGWDLHFCMDAYEKTLSVTLTQGNGNEQ